MASLTGRFRAWLASVEFAVTATAVALALAAGALAFRHSPDAADGYFVVLLVGVGVPNVYENYREPPLDGRLAGVAWAVAATVFVVACYLAVAAALRAVTAGFLPRAAAFAAAWVLAISATRLRGRSA
ncbi:hypothetical protein [Halobacterium yunchengense]|uniref:hypothetical protein n=1 Tax=Halobacterium yunchengense TaxID=3108497 RepID=UPI003008F653